MVTLKKATFFKDFIKNTLFRVWGGALFNIDPGWPIFAGAPAPPDRVYR